MFIVSKYFLKHKIILAQMLRPEDRMYKNTFQGATLVIRCFVAPVGETPGDVME